MKVNNYVGGNHSTIQHPSRKEHQQTIQAYSGGAMSSLSPKRNSIHNQSVVLRHEDSVLQMPGDRKKSQPPVHIPLLDLTKITQPKSSSKVAVAKTTGAYQSYPTKTKESTASAPTPAHNTSMTSQGSKYQSNPTYHNKHNPPNAENRFKLNLSVLNKPT